MLIDSNPETEHPLLWLKDLRQITWQEELGNHLLKQKYLPQTNPNLSDYTGRVHGN